MSSEPLEHGRFAYSPIVDRKPWTLPDGARVAVWVIPNVEHFQIDRPSTSITHATTSLVPDILNYSWRDYGNRVGVWRLMEILQKHDITATVALNADVCRFYPRIIEAGNALSWEWMGHGRNNSQLMTNMTVEEERAVIGDVVATITQGTGRKPRGWLGPALSETFNTLDLLAEAGIEYVGDWVNDEQPYRMQVKSGSMISLPYAIEINDIPVFLDARQTGDTFGQMIRDTFDVLYAEGERSARVMAIALHPFLIGHPHRSRHLDAALGYIKQHDRVWFATGSEIADWYAKSA